MYCNKFGTWNPDENNFCNQCGTPLNRRQAAEQAGAFDRQHQGAARATGPQGNTAGMAYQFQQRQETGREDPYAMFVSGGTMMKGNIEDYKTAFARIARGEPSWNWCSLLVPLWWMLYRKMYKYAALYFLIAFIGISVLLYVLSTALPQSAITVLTAVLNIGVRIAMCYLGNRLYKRHVDDQLSEITRMPPEMRMVQYKKKGGTSIPSIIIGYLILVAVLTPLVMMGQM